MQAAAAPCGTVVSLASQPRVDLLYLMPLGDWSSFEAALSSLANRFIGSVRLIRTKRAMLRQFTNARVFLSETVPNIVLVRGGEVVAHAVGALPMTELKAMLQVAIKRAA